MGLSAFIDDLQYVLGILFILCLIGGYFYNKYH